MKSEPNFAGTVDGQGAVAAKDPERIYETPMFVEDDRLMLANPGQRFQALQITATDEIPTLTKKEVSDILDVCFAFMDVTGFTPKGPAQEKAFKAMSERSEGAKVKDTLRLVLQIRGDRE